MNRAMMTWGVLTCAALGQLGCNGDDAKASSKHTGNTSSGSGGAGGEALPPNPDGDCLSNEEEAALGTNPESADTDGDGVSDCDEVACVSDPLDPSEKCYACGWKHDDPGTLVATGNKEGDVIANLDLVDQCEEPVKLWDFAKEYHILFMTAAW